MVLLRQYELDGHCTDADLNYAVRSDPRHIERQRVVARVHLCAICIEGTRGHRYGLLAGYLESPRRDRAPAGGEERECPGRFVGPWKGPHEVLECVVVD